MIFAAVLRFYHSSKDWTTLALVVWFGIVAWPLQTFSICGTPPSTNSFTSFLVSFAPCLVPLSDPSWSGNAEFSTWEPVVESLALVWIAGCVLSDFPVSKICYFVWHMLHAVAAHVEAAEVTLTDLEALQAIVETNIRRCLPEVVVPLLTVQPTCPHLWDPLSLVETQNNNCRFVHYAWGNAGHTENLAPPYEVSRAG